MLHLLVLCPLDHAPSHGLTTGPKVTAAPLAFVVERRPPGTVRRMSLVKLIHYPQSITGNYFVATNHRVIAADERYSSAYFHGPELGTVLAPLPLDEALTLAVAGSDRHRSAGFMARRNELLDGIRGQTSGSADTSGQQLWNYFTRSYPDLVRRHHPDC
jgi:hypothetical protein